MSQPVWLLRSVIDAVHDMQLTEHGGATGIRDEGLLESALARPVTAYGYGETELCMLAALYAHGISRNHPYIDGNKRTAFLSAYTFLKINGVSLVSDEVSATTVMLSVASGKMTESQLAAWLRANTRQSVDS
jgi:death-on-curing protein